MKKLTNYVIWPIWVASLIILIILTFSIVLLYSNDSKSYNTEIIDNKEAYAQDYNFENHKGEIIKSIKYIESGNNLIISFKSGKTLKIHAYKYDMKVIKQ